MWWHNDGTWGSFQSTPAKLANPGGKSSSWTLIWTAPAYGNYGVQATARDAAGNYDPTADWRTFQVSQGSTSFT
jgi:hypothetical protein